MTTTDLALPPIHEGGHVVIGAVSGLTPAHHVVVRPDGSGATDHYLPPWRQVERMSRAQWLGFVESYVIASLAGEAACEIFGFPNPRAGAGEDREIARSAAEPLDFSTASPLEAQMARLYLRSLALARQHADAIERFARTLVANHGRLAGYEVRVALVAALAGHPTPSFDDRFVIRHRTLFEAAVAGRSLSQPQLAEAWQQAELEAVIPQMKGT